MAISDLILKIEEVLFLEHMFKEALKNDDKNKINACMQLLGTAYNELMKINQILFE